jgi:hypothetical protein
MPTPSYLLRFYPTNNILRTLQIMKLPICNFQNKATSFKVIQHALFRFFLILFKEYLTAMSVDHTVYCQCMLRCVHLSPVCPFGDYDLYVRFQVLTSASMKIAVFWVVASCSQVEVYRRFICSFCLQHQGRE